MADSRIADLIDPKMRFTTYFPVLLACCIVMFYSAFIYQCFWNWLLVETIHVSTISYWKMFALVFVFNTFRLRWDLADYRWKAISVILGECIPEDKRELVVEGLSSSLKGGLLLYACSALCVEVVGLTIALIVIWIVS